MRTRAERRVRLLFAFEIDFERPVHGPCVDGPICIMKIFTRSGSEIESTKSHSPFASTASLPTTTQWPPLYGDQNTSG
jgi:hypothetical protein